MSAHDYPWRLQMALGFGKVRIVDDSGPVQRAQVQMSAAEARDATPLLTWFGFGSNPPAGSDVFYACPDGDRSKSVAIASNHAPSRLKGLPSGGCHLYDSGGRRVELPNDGTIILLAPGETLHRLVTEAFVTLFNEHTHGNGPPPSQPMTVAHLTGATRAGGP